MKIGILTYHRAENYGALLQAYAMMTYLKSLGHDVSFVDYWPKYHSDYFNIFSWKSFKRKGKKGKILMILNYILPAKHVRKCRLQRFMHERLGLKNKAVYTDSNATTEHYDVVIYGSDQIWRKQNLGGVAFDEWYYGSSNVVADKKVVYAGSMGVIETSEDDNEYVKKMMCNFDRISVRENDLKDYLQKLSIDSIQVIDPVFLLTKEQWRSLKASSKHKGEYILFYNLLNSGKARQFAEKLSQEKGLPVIEINKNPLKGTVCDASVERFLQLIDDAAYVVSNSFHGVALSLIFEKQFYAVGMGRRSNRVVSLLSNMGLCHCYITDEGLNQQNQEIDYHLVKEKLQELIACSKLFIQQSV